MPRLAFRLALAIAIGPAALVPGVVAAQSSDGGSGGGGGGIGSTSYRFLVAVRQANGDDVIRLLDQPGSSTLVNTRDSSSGETALHIVVKRSDPTYLRFLLQRGADANLRDGRGNTPLLLAVTQGDEGMASVLIDGNANVNLANQSGETPLIRAVQGHDLGLVRLLLSHAADPDQRDVMAGLSAREYAARDPRAREIAAAIAETPPAARRTVAGPHL